MEILKFYLKGTSSNVPLWMYYFRFPFVFSLLFFPKIFLLATLMHNFIEVYNNKELLHVSFKINLTMVSTLKITSKVRSPLKLDFQLLLMKSLCLNPMIWASVKVLMSIFLFFSTLPKGPLQIYHIATPLRSLIITLIHHLSPSGSIYRRYTSL